MSEGGGGGGDILLYMYIYRGDVHVQLKHIVVKC